MKSKEKVLFVDDEIDILETFKRTLRKQFNLEIALGPKEGLKKVSSNGPYAVIVSDLKMPGMDGIEFLAKVKDITPNAVRIMLTGYADVTTAIEAINKGNIFRFLTKPCKTDLLTNTISAGVRQYELVIAERELLEKTLSRSVKMLVDILSMVNPVAFGRSRRLQRYARHIANQLQLPDAWRYTISAMLSQIGCVVLPAETLEKFYAGQKTTDKEKEMYVSYPKAGCDLLIEIPRLEQVARMIEKQLWPFKNFGPSINPQERDIITLGAQILKVAIEFDQLVHQGVPAKKAMYELLKKPDECDPQIVEALRNIEMDTGEKIVRMVKVAELKTKMILNESVITKKGILLAQKDQEITYPMLKIFKNYQANNLIPKEIRVLIPKEISNL